MTRPPDPMRSDGPDANAEARAPEDAARGTLGAPEGAAGTASEGRAIEGRAADARTAQGNPSRGSIACRPAAPASLALEVRALSAGYRRGEPVVQDVGFSLATGSMTALVGPNGAGKSTLVRAILGLVPYVEAGRVAFFGTDLAAARARVAYVPQRAQVDWEFPASALDVVAMGLYARLGLLRRVGREAREASREALASVGLADAARTPIGALSGGQQQRVLVARALVQDAELLLLDEPLANVDAASEARIVSALRGLCVRGRTVLAVHHDLRGVRAHFDDAVVLCRTVVAHGPVATSLSPSILAHAYGIALEAPA